MCRGANSRLQPTNGARTKGQMLLVFTFLLGIGNFALQRAVLDSSNPAVREVPEALRRHGGRVMFAAEFALLVGAMWLVAQGHSSWGLAYLGYTAINAAAGWMIARPRR